MKYTVLLAWTLGLVSASPHQLPDLKTLKYHPRTLIACEEADDCHVLSTPDGPVMIRRDENQTEVVKALRQTPPDSKMVGPGCQPLQPRQYLSPHPNPDPHQNFVVAEPDGGSQSCNGAYASGNSVSESEQTTIGWSISATAAVTPEGIGGLFGVSITESKSWGFQHTCGCNTIQGLSCVLYFTAMTAFTANLMEQHGSSCAPGAGAKLIGPVVVYAPNGHYEGSVDGCGTNFGKDGDPNGVQQCTGQARQITIRCGPKGDSTFWKPGTGLGPWQLDFQRDMEGPDCGDPRLTNMLNKYNGTETTNV
ncbi:hypothetical protein K461DRAFT_297068 [Myriangium duriaei CBS 260.36]|uniref:Uncharacterized protein n=1 Tax=Myriangium duriaei CBS 260.36 TaxID=1168546 RepID=A0A9P4ITA9_9PEZI|nr:hypothetical protein K461DRAFT_297068 [Myriangium duriaei CBS 260.36]